MIGVLLVILVAVLALATAVDRDFRLRRVKKQLHTKKDPEERIANLQQELLLEQRRRRDLANELWEAERKYAGLLAEYEELDEIEEAEDYVRQSLGYPPEDDEESK